MFVRGATQGRKPHFGACFATSAAYSLFLVRPVPPSEAFPACFTALISAAALQGAVKSTTALPRMRLTLTSLTPATRRSASDNRSRHALLRMPESKSMILNEPARIDSLSRTLAFSTVHVPARVSDVAVAPPAREADSILAIVQFVRGRLNAESSPIRVYASRGEGNHRVASLG